MRKFLRSFLIGMALAASLRAAPDSPPSFGEQMELAAQAGDWAGVEAAGSAWKKREPEAAAPWLKEAGLALVGPVSRQSEALAILRRGQRALPGNKTLRARLAGFCQAERRPEEAALHFRWLMDQAGTSLEKFAWFAQMSFGQHDSPGRAWAHFQRAQRPNNFFWQACLNGSWATAEQLAAGLKAGRLPEDGDIALLSQMLRDVGPFDAAPVLRRLQEIQPHRWHQLQLARALIYAGQHVEANATLDAVSQAADLTGTETETAAQLYLEQCLWAKLRDFLRPKWAAFPNNYRYAYLIGCAEEELRNHTAAKAVFFDILRIHADELPAEAPCLAG
jgi:hypothetical protein